MAGGSMATPSMAGGSMATHILESHRRGGHLSNDAPGLRKERRGGHRAPSLDRWPGTTLYLIEPLRWLSSIWVAIEPPSLRKRGKQLYSIFHASSSQKARYQKAKKSLGHKSSLLPPLAYSCQRLATAKKGCAGLKALNKENFRTNLLPPKAGAPFTSLVKGLHTKKQKTIHQYLLSRLLYSRFFPISPTELHKNLEESAKINIGSSNFSNSLLIKKSEKFNSFFPYRKSFLCYWLLPFVGFVFTINKETKLFHTMVTDSSLYSSPFGQGRELRKKNFNTPYRTSPISFLSRAEGKQAHFIGVAEGSQGQLSNPLKGLNRKESYIAFFGNNKNFTFGKKLQNSTLFCTPKYVLPEKLGAGKAIFSMETTQQENLISYLLPTIKSNTPLLTQELQNRINIQSNIKEYSNFYLQSLENYVESWTPTLRAFPHRKIDGWGFFPSGGHPYTGKPYIYKKGWPSSPYSSLMKAVKSIWLDLDVCPKEVAVSHFNNPSSSTFLFNSSKIPTPKVEGVDLNNIARGKIRCLQALFLEQKFDSDFNYASSQPRKDLQLLPSSLAREESTKNITRLNPVLSFLKTSFLLDNFTKTELLEISIPHFSLLVFTPLKNDLVGLKNLEVKRLPDGKKEPIDSYGHTDKIFYNSFIAASHQTLPKKRTKSGVSKKAWLLGPELLPPSPFPLPSTTFGEEKSGNEEGAKNSSLLKEWPRFFTNVHNVLPFPIALVKFGGRGSPNTPKNDLVACSSPPFRGRGEVASPRWLGAAINLNEPLLSTREEGKSDFVALSFNSSHEEKGKQDSKSKLQVLQTKLSKEQLYKLLLNSFSKSFTLYQIPVRSKTEMPVSSSSSLALPIKGKEEERSFIVDTRESKKNMISLPKNIKMSYPILITSHLFLKESHQGPALSYRYRAGGSMATPSFLTEAGGSMATPSFLTEAGGSMATPGLRKERRGSMAAPGLRKERGGGHLSNDAPFSKDKFFFANAGKEYKIKKRKVNNYPFFGILDKYLKINPKSEIWVKGFLKEKSHPPLYIGYRAATKQIKKKLLLQTKAGMPNEYLHYSAFVKTYKKKFTARGKNLLLINQLKNSSLPFALKKVFTASTDASSISLGSNTEIKNLGVNREKEAIDKTRATKIEKLLRTYFSIKNKGTLPSVKLVASRSVLFPFSHPYIWKTKEGSASQKGLGFAQKREGTPSIRERILNNSFDSQVSSFSFETVRFDFEKSPSFKRKVSFYAKVKQQLSGFRFPSVEKPLLFSRSSKVGSPSYRYRAESSIATFSMAGGSMATPGLRKERRGSMAAPGLRKERGGGHLSNDVPGLRKERREGKVYTPRLLIKNRSFILRSSSFPTGNTEGVFTSIPSFEELKKKQFSSSFPFYKGDKKRGEQSDDLCTVILQKEIIEASLQPVGSPNPLDKTASSKETNLEKQRKYIQKKRRRKKLKKETRRRKKRKRFYPRPVWLRYRLFLKLLNKRKNADSFSNPLVYSPVLEQTKPGNSFYNNLAGPSSAITLRRKGDQENALAFLEKRRQEFHGQKSPVWNLQRAKEISPLFSHRSFPLEGRGWPLYLGSPLDGRGFDGHPLDGFPVYGRPSSPWPSKGRPSSPFRGKGKAEKGRGYGEAIMHTTKKENFTISRPILGDFKRLLWKSYWLRSNLNPYLKRVKTFLTKMKESTQKWEFFNNLKVLLNYMGGFSSFPALSYGAQKINNLTFCAPVRGVETASSLPERSSSAKLELPNSFANAVHSYPSNYYNSNGFNQWENTLYFAEYNRITYDRIQEFISQIRENFATLGFFTPLNSSSSPSMAGGSMATPSMAGGSMATPGLRKERRGGHLSNDAPFPPLKGKSGGEGKEKSGGGGKVRSSHISHSKIQDNKREDILSKRKTTDFWVKLGKAIMAENQFASPIGQQTFFKINREWWLFPSYLHKGIPSLTKQGAASLGFCLPKEKPTIPQLRILWALSKTTPSLHLESASDGLVNRDQNNKFKTNISSYLYKRKQTWVEAGKSREQTKYNKTKKMYRDLSMKFQTLLNEQYELISQLLVLPSLGVSLPLLDRWPGVRWPSLASVRKEGASLDRWSPSAPISREGAAIEPPLIDIEPGAAIQPPSPFFNKLFKKIRQKEEKYKFLTHSPLYRDPSLFPLLGEGVRWPSPAISLTMGAVNAVGKRGIHEYKKLLQGNKKDWSFYAPKAYSSKRDFSSFRKKALYIPIKRGGEGSDSINLPLRYAPQKGNQQKQNETWLNNLTGKSSYWWTLQETKNLFSFSHQNKKQNKTLFDPSAFSFGSVHSRTGNNKENLIALSLPSFYKGGEENAAFFGTPWAEEEQSQPFYLKTAWICALLFHFCSILSLLSISQIRGLLKFYLLGISKIYKTSLGILEYSYTSLSRLKLGTVLSPFSEGDGKSLLKVKEREQGKALAKQLQYPLPPRGKGGGSSKEAKPSSATQTQNPLDEQAKSFSSFPLTPLGGGGEAFGENAYLILDKVIGNSLNKSISVDLIKYYLNKDKSFFTARGKLFINSPTLNLLPSAAFQKKGKNAKGDVKASEESFFATPSDSFEGQLKEDKTEKGSFGSTQFFSPLRQISPSAIEGKEGSFKLKAAHIIKSHLSNNGGESSETIFRMGTINAVKNQEKKNQSFLALKIIACSPSMKRKRNPASFAINLNESIPQIGEANTKAKMDRTFLQSQREPSFPKKNGMTWNRPSLPFGLVFSEKSTNEKEIFMRAKQETPQSSLDENNEIRTFGVVRKTILQKKEIEFLFTITSLFLRSLKKAQKNFFLPRTGKSIFPFPHRKIDGREFFPSGGHPYNGKPYIYKKGQPSSPFKGRGTSAFALEPSEISKGSFPLREKKGKLLPYRNKHKNSSLLPSRTVGTHTTLYSLFLLNFLINNFYKFGSGTKIALKQTFDIIGRFGPKSILTFLEKPGELIIDWIAYMFLVEWSSDITNTIPENVDIYVGTSYYKLTRTLHSLNFLPKNSMQILGIENWNLGSKALPFGGGPTPNYILSEGTEKSTSWLTKGTGSKGEITILNLGSTFIQNRIYHLYEILLFQFYQPDTDLIVRQKKGIIFWDVWGDFLMQVAEDSNINISELTSLKEEQIKLLEKSSEFESLRSSALNSSLSIRGGEINQKGESVEAMKTVKAVKQNTKEKSSVLLPFQQIQKKRSINNERNSGLLSRLLVTLLPVKFNKLKTAVLFQTEGKAPFTFNAGVQRNYQSNLPFSAEQPSPLPLPIKGKGKREGCFDLPLKAVNGFPLSLNFDVSHLDGGKSQAQKQDKPNNFLPKGTNPLVPSALVQNQLLQVLHQRTPNNNNFAAQQFLSYQGKDTELFIDLHPPKSFSMISLLKKNESVQTSIGSLVCQIFSGIMSKQISKNILIVGGVSNVKESSRAQDNFNFAPLIGSENSFTSIWDRNLQNRGSRSSFSGNIQINNDFLFSQKKGSGSSLPFIGSNSTEKIARSPSPFRGEGNVGTEPQNNNQHEKTLLIQAIAGETELKIITDNAYRYAMVYRGVAVGIKLLRDVFDSLSLHTPCLFLIEDIHAIGERRPLLISDDEKGASPNGKPIFGSQREEIHEKNQVLYQLSKHVISHYRKPYKGDFSLLIPTNHFCFDLFSPLSNAGNSSVALPQGGKESLSFTSPKIFVQSKSGSSVGAGGETNNSAVETGKENSAIPFSGGVGKAVRGAQQKSRLFPRAASQVFAPPATSPFSVLNLKEEKKFKPYKIVSEMPWGGLPGEQLAQISKASYSIRVKVAVLADMAISTLSVKLDMITDLLVIIDSVKGNRGFVVFATTHVPSILDPALRRPGRLDETITLGLFPNLLSRWDILKSSFGLFITGKEQTGFKKGISLDLTYSIGSSVLPRFVTPPVFPLVEFSSPVLFFSPFPYFPNRTVKKEIKNCYAVQKLALSKKTKPKIKEQKGSIRYRAAPSMAFQYMGGPISYRTHILESHLSNDGGSLGLNTKLEEYKMHFTAFTAPLLNKEGSGEICEISPKLLLTNNQSLKSFARYFSFGNPLAQREEEVSSKEFLNFPIDNQEQPSSPFFFPLKGEGQEQLSSSYNIKEKGYTEIATNKKTATPFLSSRRDRGPSLFPPKGEGVVNAVYRNNKKRIKILSQTYFIASNMLYEANISKEVAEKKILPIYKEVTSYQNLNEKAVGKSFGVTLSGQPVSGTTEAKFVPNNREVKKVSATLQMLCTPPSYKKGEGASLDRWPGAAIEGGPMQHSLKGEREKKSNFLDFLQPLNMETSSLYISLYASPQQFKNHIIKLMSGKLGEMFLLSQPFLKETRNPLSASRVLWCASAGPGPLSLRSRRWPASSTYAEKEDSALVASNYNQKVPSLAPVKQKGGEKLEGAPVLRPHHFSPSYRYRTEGGHLSNNVSHPKGVSGGEEKGVFLSKEHSNLFSFTNTYIYNNHSNTETFTSFGLSNTWKLLSSLILSFVQKRYLYNNNLIVPKFLDFNNKNSLYEPPSPPSSNILLPARRYENYRRSFAFFSGRKISMNIMEKIQVHQQQRLVKRLYGFPVKESFKSEIRTYSSLRSEGVAVGAQLSTFTSMFKPSDVSKGSTSLMASHYMGGHQGPEEKNQLFSRSLLPSKVLSKVKGEGDKQENSFTSFTNATLMIGSLSSVLQKPSNSNWFIKNRILMRHKNYLTNQWWNGQLPEHNAETTFLSDIDWRYSFVESIGDLLLDFPDADQHYNPRNRRWLLTKGDYHNWFNFEKNYYTEIYTHFIFDSFIKAYHLYEENREVLDFYAFYILKKGLYNISTPSEIETITLYKRFFLQS